MLHSVFGYLAEKWITIKSDHRKNPRIIMIKRILLEAVAFVAVLLLMTSCNNKGTPTEIEYLNDFHRAYFMTQDDVIDEDELALYVDYSTCIAQAMGTNQTPASHFYMAMVPTISNATKRYWSIKGSTISEESGDVYTLLRSVTEVNYADLASAVNKIANGKTEAVFLTDGEFYEQTIAKSHVNDPYMAPAIETWLKRGHDIYVFSEPYTEYYRGNQYEKKRFYFLFTDTRLKDNIFDRVRKNVRFEDYPDVKYYHLTANNPTLMTTNTSFESSSTPHELLECTPEGHGSYEIQDWSLMDWKNIGKYILQAYDENTGELIPDGEPVISGLKLDKNFQGGCYRIEDIDLVISNINEEYTAFVDSIYAGLKAYQIADIMPVQLSPAEHFMKLDKDEFKKHGDINIHFDVQNFNPEILDSKPYNYFKIDIIVKSFINNFSHNPMAEAIFEFQSIDRPGETNRSIAESIKQAVSKTDVAGMIQGKTIYTIYVRSNKY